MQQSYNSMIRYAFFLLHMACSAPNNELSAQWSGDSLLRGVITKSECIVNAQIVEIGRRIRMEDGVIEFDIRCAVQESFKGKMKPDETITVHMIEFTLNAGGKYLDGDEGSNLYADGNSLILFLEPGESMSETTDPEYKPVDVLLGAMQPSEQLTHYLRMYVQNH